MKAKVFGAVVVAAALGVSLSAHIMVSPPESKSGATQNYELRVHNEEKIAIKSVELTIPDGITVMTIGKAPAGAYTTAKTGDRITSLTWTVDVAPSKYLALPFTAKNPVGPREVKWNTRAHMTDGSVIEWSDDPKAEEKPSVTKIAAAVAAAPAMAQAAPMMKAPIGDADLSKAMKDINASFMSLQRSNAAMNHAQGAADAQKLSDLFRSVRAYWEAKKVDDAVAAAKSAVAAADATVKASNVMDMTALTTAQQQLSASCSACHTAHREKLADGTYRIK